MNNNCHSNNAGNFVVSYALLRNARAKEASNKMKRATLTQDELKKIEIEDREEHKVFATYIVVVLLVGLVVCKVKSRQYDLDLEDYFMYMVGTFIGSLIVLLIVYLICGLSLWFV